MSKELIEYMKTHDICEGDVKSLIELAESQALEIDRWKSLASQINTDWIPANQKLCAEIDELKRRLSQRDNECLTITKKQLRAWIEDGMDDGSSDWRGENEV